MIVIALIFGVLLVIPIGGADMPTVIALLNSYAGLVRRAMGFVLEQQAADHRRRARRLLRLHPLGDHVQGDEPLVHQRAVRRVRAGADQRRRARRKRRRCAARPPKKRRRFWRRRSKVVIVPGYGMAVAQAQHKVRELYDALTKRGVDVKFAHPSGGRPHARAHERAAGRGRHSLRQAAGDGRDQRRFPQTDVALVIGANDVTNPAARTDTSSPIYGMPILDVDKARTVMVIKRSMARASRASTTRCTTWTRR